MEKRELLYEGKAKRVYSTDDPEVLVVSYKDDATAQNGLKRGTIEGKGAINNRMSNYLMEILGKHGVPTHLVRELSERETLVRRVEIVPLEVIVRNISAGSFAVFFALLLRHDLLHIPCAAVDAQQGEAGLLSEPALSKVAVIQPESALEGLPEVFA